MDKEEFMEGIHILQNNYHKKLSADQLKLYYANLKDISKEEFLKNINEQIKSNQFMPNIAQLRNKQSINYTNYEQRNYEEIDLNQFYANRR